MGHTKCTKPELANPRNQSFILTFIAHFQSYCEGFLYVVPLLSSRDGEDRNSSEPLIFIICRRRGNGVGVLSSSPLQQVHTRIHTQCVTVSLQ